MFSLFCVLSSWPFFSFISTHISFHLISVSSVSHRPPVPFWKCFYFEMCTFALSSHLLCFLSSRPFFSFLFCSSLLVSSFIQFPHFFLFFLSNLWQGFYFEVASLGSFGLMCFFCFFLAFKNIHTHICIFSYFAIWVLLSLDVGDRRGDGGKDAAAVCLLFPEKDWTDSSVNTVDGKTNKSDR